MYLFKIKVKNKKIKQLVCEMNDETVNTCLRVNVFHKKKYVGK